MTFRSLLFVPGDRPDRFEKALAAGASAVCVDLEDAVPPPQKAAARAYVLERWLSAVAPAGVKRGVRLNGLSTMAGFMDVAALAESFTQFDFVMIPKVETAAELRALRSAIGVDAPAFWPIVESGRGVEAAYEIASAVTPNGGLLFGGVDYSADVGCTLEWEALAYARGRLAAASGAAGVELLDVPYLDVKDVEGLRESTRRAKALGFTGRACIHPSQVEPVNDVYTPTEAEIAFAQKVIQALETARGAAALLDGKLVERPVILAAQRVLARAGIA